MDQRGELTYLSVIHKILAKAIVPNLLHYVTIYFTKSLPNSTTTMIGRLLSGLTRVSFQTIICLYLNDRLKCYAANFGTISLQRQRGAKSKRSDK